MSTTPETYKLGGTTPYPVTAAGLAQCAIDDLAATDSCVASYLSQFPSYKATACRTAAACPAATTLIQPYLGKTTAEIPKSSFKAIASQAVGSGTTTLQENSKENNSLYVRKTGILSNESLTVFLGGAGMVGAYNQDMVDALEEVGIRNAAYGNYSSLPTGWDSYLNDALGGLGGIFDNVADASAVVFYNQAPNDPIVVEYGKLCEYLVSEQGDLLEEKEILGIIKIKTYSKNIYKCESADFIAFRFKQEISAVEKATFSLGDIGINTEVPSGDFNIVGYSWGSIIASRSALYYAEQDVFIKNLVLIGSPVNKSLLNAVKVNNNIGQVTVINLTEHGDPIYAGMTDEEIINSSTLLGDQMLNGVGHFYYSGDNQEGKERRRALAKYLYQVGLR